MLQEPDIPAGCDLAGLLANLRVDPALIDLLDRLGYGPPAPEDDKLTFQAWDIVRKMAVFEIVVDDVADKALEFL